MPTKPPPLPEALSARPVIGILRRCPFHHAVSMAAAAIESGLTVMEVTMDSERPLEQINSLRTKFPNADIGVGSVRRAEEVGPAVEAGATFVVSPILDPEVVAKATSLRVASLPGAATPTEIEQAIRAGATAVKVFPIDELGGLAYLSAILTPLGSPSLIPTGGIAVDSISKYLAAGALAVGLGGALFPRDALDTGDVASVAKIAASVIEALS